MPPPPQKELNETEAYNMSKKEFRLMLIHFINWMDKKIKTYVRIKNKSKVI